MSRFLTICAVSVACAVLAFGQNIAAITGQVTDPSGSPIAAVAITVTNTATHTATQATSDESGNYSVTGLSAGPYDIHASRPGFQIFDRNVELAAGQSLSTPINMNVSAVQQTVVVNGGTQPGATPQPTQTDVFLSDQTLRVLDRTEMDMLGPIAGAAQVIGLAPGARVTGYGNTGATKYTISINGINQGWGGYGGYSGGAALGITFDGIPIVDPATGLWQTATIPQLQLIQDTAVTYGPGNPMDRWYTNVGGSVEFTPLQPGNQFHGDLMLTYGSYNQKNLQFDLSSPVYKGWSTIVAGGLGQGDDFRNGPDGFGSPSKDLAFYDKTIKTFGQSSIDFGGYFAQSSGFRPQVIPTTPVDGLGQLGIGLGPLYSQQTSGFYSTLPQYAYNKYDVNQMGLAHVRENLHVSDNTQIENLTWYMHIHRLHDRLADVYNLGPQVYEYNNPHTDDFGDSFSLTHSFAMNLVSVGGYFLHGTYNTRQNFYNPLLGGAGGPEIVNIGRKIRNGYFAQNNGAVFVQDALHISKLTITPGIRYVRFSTDYSNQALQEFNFLPGVVLSQFCSLTQIQALKGNTRDQGSTCNAYEARYGFEPSVNANYQALPWLSFYGGYDESLRSPEMGGGGGLFQQVDPATYHLSRTRYGAFGFKVHEEGAGVMNNLIFGANLFRETYSAQEIDITNGNGDTISANGASRYQGLNYFLDDDPVRNLHVFLNGNVEAARYTTYVVDASGDSYNGIPVPYVPASTFNLGATYNFKIRHVSFIPVAAFQFVGTQTIFNNQIAAPSNLTMSSYGTLNAGLTVPFKHIDIIFNGLNLLNKKYNEYLYVSSGGYFSTPTAGYELAYPAAPFEAYGGVRFHF